jgi:hypothetical protein
VPAQLSVLSSRVSRAIERALNEERLVGAVVLFGGDGERVYRGAVCGNGGAHRAMRAGWSLGRWGCRVRSSRS